MMRLGPGRLPKDRKSGHLCKPLLPSDLRLIQVPFVQAGQTIGSPGGESQSAGVPFDPFGSAPDRTHLLSPADPHASLDGLRVEYGIEKSSNKLLALTELDSDTWVSNTPPLLPGCHRQGPKPSPHKRQTSGQKPTDKRARTPGEETSLFSFCFAPSRLRCSTRGGRTLHFAPGGWRSILRGMATEPLLQFDLPGVRKLRSGKVRDIFDLGDRLLFVATDRISAFDCIMPNGIPRKGEVLTQLSYFWFSQTESFQPNHLLSRPDAPLPSSLQPYAAQLARRSMIVKKAQPFAIECVVRGYLAGSGWKEYREQQTVCGIKLPPGLKESAELPAPIFTPATKAESGHDINIPFAEAARMVGAERAEQVRDASLKLYRFARDYARRRGIIIADTKFEFGLLDGKAHPD